jgi:hypothetical protein
MIGRGSKIWFMLAQRLDLVRFKLKWLQATQIIEQAKRRLVNFPTEKKVNVKFYKNTRSNVVLAAPERLIAIGFVHFSSVVISH